MRRADLIQRHPMRQGVGMSLSRVVYRYVYRRRFRSLPRLFSRRDTVVIVEHAAQPLASQN